MVFVDRLDRGATFDTEKFRKYSSSGEDKFDYLVWPAMLLHQGGPLLAKGVAQPIQSIRDDGDDGDDDEEEEDELVGIKEDNNDLRTPASRGRYSVTQPDDRYVPVSESRNSQDRLALQTPPKVYKRAPDRDNNVPRTPYFNPNSSRAPFPKTPQGVSTVPDIHAADDAHRRRNSRTQGGYMPEHGNLTVAWKNKKEERLPSAP